jgi:hypothetical protein
VEYQKTLLFLKIGCSCGCFAKIPPEEFTKLRVNLHSSPKKSKKLQQKRTVE